MVMAQGSAENDAAEAADLHQLLPQRPLLDEQEVADLQASLADQLQDLRAGRSRHRQVILGEWLNMALGINWNIDCVLLLLHA